MFLSKNLRIIMAITILLLELRPPITTSAGGTAPNQSAFQHGIGSGTVSLSNYLPLIFQSVDTSNNLSNGGTYEGEGGVGLGAPANSLISPIDVTITKTGTPTQTLPSQAQFLNGVFQVSASTVVTLSTQNPLILAIPVPTGANTANLALAMLQNGASLTDADENSIDWTFQEGMYDANQGLFLTTISSLSPSGDTIALVEHPDFDSPANTAPQMLSGSSGPQAPSLFNVRCIGFTNPTDCTTATETTVADYLTNIYDQIHQVLMFKEPRLRFLDETLNYDPPSLSLLGYTAYIEPFNFGFCGTEPAAGYYDPGNGRLVICLNPALGLNTYYVHVLIHEYFHATQYGYNPVYNEYLVSQDERWTIEGTAKSAEESYFSSEMLRSTLGTWEQLHKVDLSLKSTFNLDEYDTQDFWVFYGQHTHQGLAYLDSVLNGGVQASEVAKTIGSGNYLDPYWDWAKNQVMEAQVNFGGALTTPCQLEFPVLNQTERFDYHWDTKPFYDVTIPALTTKIVDVHWDFKYTGASGQVFAPLTQPPEANQAVRFKFYEEGESSCQSVPDGDRVYQNPDPAKQYYVVISNIDPTELYTYRVGFEVAPIPPSQ
jgi:hypothetical protein